MYDQPESWLDLGVKAMNRYVCKSKQAVSIVSSCSKQDWSTIASDLQISAAWSVSTCTHDPKIASCVHSIILETLLLHSWCRVQIVSIVVMIQPILKV